jgi:hypothetical protein
MAKSTFCQSKLITTIHVEIDSEKYENNNNIKTQLFMRKSSQKLSSTYSDSVIF